MWLLVNYQAVETQKIDLPNKRAKMVRDYLIKQGVSKARLSKTWTNVFHIFMAGIEPASKQGIQALSTCLLSFNCREG